MIVRGRLSWMVVDGKPYVDVMALEAILRDSVEDHRRLENEDAALALESVADIMAAVVRRDRYIEIDVDL